MNFRGSIARLWHWLSTLRRMGHPITTQDSLPAVGQTLPDGLAYPQGSTERFSRCILHLSLLSQAFMAQGQALNIKFGGLAGGARTRKGRAKDAQRTRKGRAKDAQRTRKGESKQTQVVCGSPLLVRPGGG
jgi:hypothetical protein